MPEGDCLPEREPDTKWIRDDFITAYVEHWDRDEAEAEELLKRLEQAAAVERTEES